MNIFYLSNDVAECARYHNDRHTVKMILEYAQLLSTAHRFLDGVLTTGLSDKGRKKTSYVIQDSRNDILYSATHINHPSAKWTRVCSSHYKWLYELFCAVCDEYSYRYGKVHLTDTKLREVLKQPPKNIGRSEMFEAPWRAMPDQFKVKDDTIQSYRNYYNGAKQHLASWKKREVPHWYTGEFNADLHVHE